MKNILWLIDTISEIEEDIQNINNTSALFCSYFGDDSDARSNVASHLSENSDCKNYVNSIENIVIGDRNDLLNAFKALQFVLERHPEHIAEVSKMIPQWHRNIVAKDGGE